MDITMVIGQYVEVRTSSRKRAYIAKVLAKQGEDVILGVALIKGQNNIMAERAGYTRAIQISGARERYTKRVSRHDFLVALRNGTAELLGTKVSFYTGKSQGGKVTLPWHEDDVLGGCPDCEKPLLEKTLDQGGYAYCSCGYQEIIDFVDAEDDEDSYDN